MKFYPILLVKRKSKLIVFGGLWTKDVKGASLWLHSLLMSQSAIVLITLAHISGDEWLHFPGTAQCCCHQRLKGTSALVSPLCLRLTPSFIFIVEDREKAAPPWQPLINSHPPQLQQMGFKHLLNIVSIIFRGFEAAVPALIWNIQTLMEYVTRTKDERVDDERQLEKKGKYKNKRRMKQSFFSSASKLFQFGPTAESPNEPQFKFRSAPMQTTHTHRFSCQS